MRAFPSFKSCFNCFVAQAKVTVALQLESGVRLTGEFHPSISLWDMLRRFESEHGENFTRSEVQSGAASVYRQPAISVNQREVFSACFVLLANLLQFSCFPLFPLHLIVCSYCFLFLFFDRVHSSPPPPICRV